MSPPPVCGPIHQVTLAPAVRATGGRLRERWLQPGGSDERIPAHNIPSSHIHNFSQCKSTLGFLLKVKSMTNPICQSRRRRLVLTICNPTFTPIDLLIDSTAEKTNSSTLLQQTGASKHIELPYFQDCGRQVLPQKEKSDKGPQGLFIFTFFTLKPTRCASTTYFRM